MSPFPRLTILLTVACVAAAAASALAVPTPPPPPPPQSAVAAADTAEDGSPTGANQSEPAPRDAEDGSKVLESSTAETALTGVAEAVKDVTSLVDINKGHEHLQHNKNKKKKPLGKHKKKKQSFKDKLMPLLLIPFVIQTMLIPLFITNLKLLALKAMAVGKFAIILIVFNMMRSWSQNAHSTSIRGTSGDSMLMAQNYGFNGVPEFGALFNGR